jgi:hypothetical protein
MSINYKKVIVVRFFWVNDSELNKITFDSWKDYYEWKKYQKKSIEILSEKEEVETV